MTITITMYSSNDVWLDSRTALDEGHASQILIEMVKDAGELHSGDRFTITQDTILSPEAEQRASAAFDALRNALEP